MVDLTNQHDKEVWRDGFMSAMKIFCPSVSTNTLPPEPTPEPVKVTEEDDFSLIDYYAGWRDDDFQPFELINKGIKQRIYDPHRFYPDEDEVFEFYIEEIPI